MPHVRRCHGDSNEMTGHSANSCRHNCLTKMDMSAAKVPSGRLKFVEEKRKKVKRGAEQVTPNRNEKASGVTHATLPDCTTQSRRKPKTKNDKIKVFFGPARIAVVRHSGSIHHAPAPAVRAVAVSSVGGYQ